MECRRLDRLEEEILKSDNVAVMLSYCINVSQMFVNRREYRCEVRLSLPFNEYVFKEIRFIISDLGYIIVLLESVI